MWVWVRVRACVRCRGASCVAGAALAAWAAPPSLSQWPVARPLSTQLTASPRLAQANVLSSWGPYTSTIGQVYKKNDLSLPAVTTRPMDSTKMPA